MSLSIPVLSQPYCPDQWTRDGATCYNQVGGPSASYSDLLTLCTNSAGLAFPEASLLSLHSADELTFLQGIPSHNRAQRLINLEVPVLVRSLQSSNVELG